jgi:hypothetical protein
MKTQKRRLMWHGMLLFLLGLITGLLEQLRIPMKWGTDSSASGAASRQATLVTAIITEVPHLSQYFCAW